MSGRESSCRRRQLSSKISGLSGLLSISSILSLVLLVFPRPSKGSVWESTQTHVGAGTRALLGPRASASRRRALRGAARGGADAVSRFPLLAPEARCGALRTPSTCVVAWPQGDQVRVLRAPQRASSFECKQQKVGNDIGAAMGGAAQRATAGRRSERSEQSSFACPHVRLG